VLDVHTKKGHTPTGWHMVGGKTDTKCPPRELQEALRGGGPKEGQGVEGGMAGAGSNVIELLVMEDGGGPACVLVAYNL